MAINHWWRPPGWKDTVEIEKKMKYQLLKDIKNKFQKNKENQKNSFPTSDEL